MLAALLTTALLQQPVPGPDFTSHELWEAWPGERALTVAAPCLRHETLLVELEKLDREFGDRLQVEEVGRSFENRSIHLMTLGRGDRKVLLWSQMHGDEPSATPALLDVARYLLTHEAEPGPGRILDELTLLMVPMLNPDGSEIYERRNAQAIDVNRDALDLATPEGRLLKELRDRHQPLLGFNLHDQNRRTAVGETGRLATNAVLAVAGDPEGTVTPGRLRAKRACAAIVAALAPLMPGGMARYDEDWSPRAFGDNLTAWGTPVVLIESGGLPPGREMTELTRLNFVALLTALSELARNDLVDHDPRLYEELERNQRGAWADVVVREGRILQPGTGTSYSADLAFDLLRGDRRRAGCADDGEPGSRIVEIGDARFLGAGRQIDAAGGLVVAPLEISVEGWKARRWLDAGELSRLASQGVGTVVWRVPARRREAAAAIARGLTSPGRARLRLAGEGEESLPLTLSSPLGSREPESLGALVRALGGGEIEDGDGTLGALWPRRPRPELRPGSPASFLVVAPWDADSGGAGRARVEGVWIDGRELRGER